MRNVSVVRLNVATRSSGPPASGKIIKEMPGSVASGTRYILRQHYCTSIVNIILFHQNIQHMTGHDGP
jgi:hypothetical protein